jgi:acyl-CoA synthetase (AMP-forming)/AMP-acid ligase II
LLGVDLAPLESLYNGSERVVPSTLQSFTDRFSNLGFSMNKFVPCYGLAEATLAVTASTLNRGPVSVRANRDELATGRFQGSDDGVELVGCGRPLGETDVRVLDTATESELQPGEIGEICVSGKSVARDYGRMEGESHFVMIHDSRFLRTGDLGFVLDDELFLTGRIKDVIIIRGKNHDPSEIERASFTSHPALNENGAAAFSIVAEDIERLVVVQEVRRTFARQSDFTDVIDSIVGGVSETHGVVPYDIGVILPGTLPKTTSGKIQRSKCRELWMANKFEVIASLTRRAASRHA